MTHGDYAVRAFGRLEVHGPRGAVQLGGPRPRTVFALLLVEAGQPVSTDRLVDETWGASPPSGARRTLQAYIANLRRARGSDDGPLQSANSGYVVDADRIDVDLRRFEDLAHQGRALAVSDASAASDVLRRALDLWIDEPFADLPADDVPTLAVERVRLSELRLDVIEQRVAAELAAGHHSRLVPELEKLVAKHPVREGLWAKLMVALHESGRSAEALGAARRLRHHLTTELGLDPGDEVRTLAARIAAGERLVHARGLCLRLRTDGPVVGNDLAADDVRLIVLTGANQGGKSTFLRAIGLAQLKLQCGMFVAAESLRASPCTGLFTHHRREEDATMQRGKLDEELHRMSELTDHLHSGCMLLCNESFASTNEHDGSQIGLGVVEALLDSGVRVVFVTHLYELADHLRRERSDRALFLRAERGVDGQRTFELVEGDPLPTSYGQDLYRRIFADDATDEVDAPVVTAGR